MSKYKFRIFDISKRTRRITWTNHFSYLSNLFYFSLKDLNYEVEIGELDESSINVIIAAPQHIVPDDNLEKYKYIIYQLEFMTQSNLKRFYTPFLTNLYKNAITNWDYLPHNVTFFSNEKIKSRLLPLGFHEKMEDIYKFKKIKNKTNDVLFYGSLGNTSRKNILLNLKNTPFKKIITDKIELVNRINIISNSKIILNLHAYKENFEIVRCSELWNNKIFTICEEPIPPPYNLVEPVSFKTPEELIKLCDYYIKNDDKRKEITEKNYENFKKYFDMRNILEKAIKRL